MSDPRNHDRLSFGDALFLHLEREGMPLHVASLALFEGRISLDECIAYIGSKLPLVPRYRQHLVSSPFNLGLPSWRYDHRFDIRNHVGEIKLKRGTEAEVKAVASQLLSSPMDRSRPLWDMTLLQEVRGGRTGVLLRVHHCLADGLSGVGLMNVMLDTKPVTEIAPARKHRLPASPPPAQSLVEGLLDACSSAVEQALTAHSEWLSLAEHLLAAARKPAESDGGTGQPGLHGDAPMPSPGELEKLLPELLGPAERLPFNVICRGPQKYERAQIPLAELKAVKHACGVTLNDVVLALVTSAVGRYLQAHGVALRGRSLRVVVPVSLRRKAEVDELGNRITFVPVTIPLGLRRMRKIVAAVHKKVALLKRAHVAELVGFAGTLLGTVPAPLQAVLGPIASQLPISTCNLICTNVPGPKVPLFLMGHKMLSCHPYVPIGGEMGMNCAVLTYDRTAYFGFTTDVNAVPDGALFPKFLVASFADLRKEVGVARRRAEARAPREQASAVADPPAETEDAKPVAAVIAFPEPPASQPPASPGEEGPAPEAVVA